jgi:hypothetical protein
MLPKKNLLITVAVNCLLNLCGEKEDLLYFVEKLHQHPRALIAIREDSVTVSFPSSTNQKEKIWKRAERSFLKDTLNEVERYLNLRRTPFTPTKGTLEERWKTIQNTISNS